MYQKTIEENNHIVGDNTAFHVYAMTQTSQL